MQLKSNIPDIIEKLERIKIQVGAAGNVPPIPDFSDAMFSALNSGMAVMKQRIFNKGLDAEGDSFGRYIGRTTKLTKLRAKNQKDDSDEIKKGKATFRKNFRAFKKTSGDDQGLTEYEKFRIGHGRQIGFKDLEFEGALRRSIEVVKADNGKVVIAIVNPETAKISQYQEQQIGNIRATGFAKGTNKPARIFSLSESEFNYIKQEGNAAIKAVIQNIIQTA